MSSLIRSALLGVATALLVASPALTASDGVGQRQIQPEWRPPVWDAPLAPSNVFGSVVGSSVTITWSEASWGAAATGYEVLVGSAPGLSDIAVIPVVSPTLQAEAVPPGVYFVRVASRNTKGVSAPTRDLVIDVSARATDSASLPYPTGVRLSWLAPVTVEPLSYLVNARVGSLAAGQMTTVSQPFLDVPSAVPGRYFVQVFAVTPSGLAPVTHEAVVIVPRQ